MLSTHAFSAACPAATRLGWVPAFHIYSMRNSRALVTGLVMLRCFHSIATGVGFMLGSNNRIRAAAYRVTLPCPAAQLLGAGVPYRTQEHLSFNGMPTNKDQMRG